MKKIISGISRQCHVYGKKIRKRQYRLFLGYLLISVFLRQYRSQRDKLGFLGRVFLLMGCSKNYIMYWGVFTIYIIA